MKSTLKSLSKYLRVAADELDREKNREVSKLERHVSFILAAVRDQERDVYTNWEAAHRSIPHVLEAFDSWGLHSMKRIRTASVAQDLWEAADSGDDFHEIVSQIDLTILALKRLRRIVKREA